MQLHHLLKYLNLPDDYISKNRIQQLTQSKKKEYRKHEVERNSKDYLNIWKKQLTKEEIKESLTIYETLNDTYPLLTV